MKKERFHSTGYQAQDLSMPVDCSNHWATEFPHNFSHRLYLSLFGYEYIMNYLQIFPIISVDYVDN